MITAMNQSTVREIHEAVMTELRPLAQKLGLTLTTRGGRFDPSAGTYSPKIEFKVAGEAGAKIDRAEWDRYAPLFGLTPEHYGKTFSSNGSTYTVVGIAPNRSKRPVICARADGKRFVFDANGIKVLLLK